MNSLVFLVVLVAVPAGKSAICFILLHLLVFFVLVVLSYDVFFSSNLLCSVCQGVSLSLYDSCFLLQGSFSISMGVSSRQAAVHVFSRLHHVLK